MTVDSTLTLKDLGLFKPFVNPSDFAFKNVYHANVWQHFLAHYKTQQFFHPLDMLYWNS